MSGHLKRVENIFRIISSFGIEILLNDSDVATLVGALNGSDGWCAIER